MVGLSKDTVEEALKDFKNKKHNGAANIVQYFFFKKLKTYSTTINKVVLDSTDLY